MQQPSTPVHLDLLKKEESKAASSPGAYTCQICGNSASRINVIMMCTKMCNEKAKNSKAAGNSKATNSPKATPKKTKATSAKETSSRAKSTQKLRLLQLLQKQHQKPRQKKRMKSHLVHHQVEAVVEVVQLKRLFLPNRIQFLLLLKALLKKRNHE